MFILACVVSSIAACHDQSVTGPLGPTVPPPSFSQGSPDVPVHGCAKWKVTLTGGSGITVTTVAIASCGPLVPLLDVPATYDPVTKIISMTIADTNKWTREVVAPARDYAWNDSIAITTPAGLVNGTTGTYLRLINMDSTIGATATTFKNARLWWYDTLLVAHGQPQILNPTGKTRQRTIKIQIVSGAPTVFTVLIRVQGQNAHPVTMTPPAGAPRGTLADTNLIVDTVNYGLTKLVKNMVDVGFTSTSTQSQRQAAIDSVLGTVVGGHRISSNGDGLYTVKLPTSTAAGIAAALAKLRALSQVTMAEPILLSVGPNGRLPNDGPGWGKSNFGFSTPDRTGSTWALEVIHAPLAWGCDTGSVSDSKIAVIDWKFFGPFDNSNVVSPDANLWPDFWRAQDAHGTSVAAIAAARGDNGQLITGVSWVSQLRLYDFYWEGAADTSGDVQGRNDMQMLVDAIGRAAHDGSLAIASD